MFKRNLSEFQRRFRRHKGYQIPGWLKGFKRSFGGIKSVSDKLREYQRSCKEFQGRVREFQGVARVFLGVLGVVSGSPGIPGRFLRVSEALLVFFFRAVSGMALGLPESL